MPTESITIEVLSPEDKQEMLAVVSANALPLEASASLQASFAPAFAEARAIIEQSRNIVVTDASQRLQIKLARDYRHALRDIRVSSDKARKVLKEESLRRGKAIDGFYAILLHLTDTEEKRLQAQEDFAELQEAKRIAALKSARESVLVGLNIDPKLYALGEMSEETFQTLVEGTKLARAAQAEAARKAEAEKIARKAAELTERERVRLENERLRREAEEQRAALKAEYDRVAAERARQQELVATRKQVLLAIVSPDTFAHIPENMLGVLSEVEFEGVVADMQAKKAERERAELERAAVEKELKRLAEEKAVAEAKAKAEREAAEVAARIERQRVEKEKAAAEHAAFIQRQAAEKKAADDLAEQKRIADEAAAVERKRVADEQRVADELAKAERAAAAKKAAAELAEAQESARKEKLRLQALAEVERIKNETVRKVAAEKAEQDRKDRERIEGELRAVKEAQAQREAAEREAARKAAAAPDKDRLLTYANAIRALDIPTFSTLEAQAVGQLVASQQAKFVRWLEDKAGAL